MVQLSDTKFKQYLEKKIRKTIRINNLFSKTDKIGVAVSGGKDSTVCLYILKRLGYNVEAITINALIGNYSKENLDNIREVCTSQGIKLHEVSFRQAFLSAKGYKYQSCMLCGVLKRYLLNKHSKRLKFDYLATGHNLDDEAEAFMMNVFRNDFKLARRQGPISKETSANKFVRRVKPLFFISNEETERYSRIMKFPVRYEICPCSIDAHRREYRVMLAEWEKKNPGVKYSIVRFQQEMKTNLKAEEKTQPGVCLSCGEPSSGKICKTCHIFKEMELKK
jgi:tRNA-5-methyluridine54 2-sulfurtransferase